MKTCDHVHCDEPAVTRLLAPKTTVLGAVPDGSLSKWEAWSCAEHLSRYLSAGWVDQKEER